MTAVRLPRLAALALLGLTGCTLLSGPKIEPTRFYVLTAASGAPAPMSSLRIGLGPVRFPGYLDRPQMALRADTNRIEYSEWARWAEPLKDNFERVLGSDIGAQLGTDRIIRFPWYKNISINYSVSVDITRFERQATNEVSVVGRWTLRDGESGDSLVSNPVDLRRPAATPEEAASAMSEMIAEVATQIAAEIQRRPAH